MVLTHLLRVPELNGASNGWRSEGPKVCWQSSRRIVDGGTSSFFAPLPVGLAVSLGGAPSLPKRVLGEPPLILLGSAQRSSRRSSRSDLPDWDSGERTSR